MAILRAISPSGGRFSALSNGKEAISKNLLPEFERVLLSLGSRESRPLPQRGLPPRGDTDDPLHLETVDRILASCRKHGVPVGIHTGGLAYTQRRLEAGFNFVTLGTDSGFLMQAVSSDLAAARGTQEK